MPGLLPVLLLALNFSAAFFIAGCGGSDDGQGAGNTGGEIVFHAADGDVRLAVEVARTTSEREQGLMHREELDEDSGMIFIWDRPTTGGFWMKNTLIPLSIAFISQEGAIIDIQDMQPQTLDSHSPGRSYMYAVEVNQGYFGEKGIAVGDMVDVADID